MCERSGGRWQGSGARAPYRSGSERRLAALMHTDDTEPGRPIPRIQLARARDSVLPSLRLERLGRRTASTAVRATLGGQNGLAAQLRLLRWEAYNHYLV